MNKREKEILQAQLDNEKAVLKQLEKQYQAALNDIDQKIKLLTTDELTQSRIYQIEYQKALRKQISSILDKLQGDEFSTIQQYLHDSYTTAFVGTAYDIAGQGIPLIMPIDQAAAVRAIQTDSKLSEGLYNALGVDIKGLKKAISSEVARGIATNQTFSDIARNISNVSKAPLANAKRIARTEGHRIQQASAYDAQQAAKAKGADVVKQWDSTLDGATRPVHRELDGQIREVNEPFSAHGKKAMYPGDFGDPAEDCNCRCVSLTRARWGLDEDELQTLKDRAEFFGLDKTENFEDFQKKYLKAVKSIGTQGTSQQANDINDTKDFAELDKYLKAKYNISMDKSVQALDFDNVKSALTGVERAIQDLPEIGNSLKEIKTSKSGVMSCDGTSVSFNPVHFADHNTVLDRCKKYDGGWWVKNASPASIGYHECAHAFEQVLIDANTSYQSNVARILAWNDCTEAKAIVSQACKNIKKTPFGKGKKNDELKETISMYAKDTASETMAEALADVFANGSNASPLSLEIQRLTIERYKTLKGIQP